MPPKTAGSGALRPGNHAGPNTTTAAPAMSSSSSSRSPTKVSQAASRSSISSRSTTTHQSWPALSSKPHSLLLLPALAAFILVLSLLACWSHYYLPQPVTLAQSALSESAGKGALFSEERTFQVMQKLAIDIGYRIVGTKQHVQAEEWLESEIKPLIGWHQTGEGRGNGTQVEMWTQIGDGAHRFDFMHNVVFKRYMNMSNVIVRLSDGTDEGKEHAVLINGHLDSTLPSPGAADDGVAIGIMLELLRIFTTSPRPKLRHSIILLFNNGEESLQDASHLYITQHEPTRHSVRAVVNLEACGVSGPELLFQADSEQLVEAYAKAPRPFGTILANDVFGSGIILSDTDARQFAEYGNVPMLDMAIVGNSYLYHTRKDVPKYIQPGVAQHFGENVLAIVQHLTTDPKSKLANVKQFPKRMPPIYFTIAGKYFIHISNKAWKGLSMAMSAFANFFLSSTVRAEKHFGSLQTTTLAIFAVVLSLFASLISANLVALIMTQVLNKGMSWFSHELYPVVLYGPPAVAGSLAVQLASSYFFTGERRASMERATLNGMFAIFALSLMCLNAFGIGSAYLFGLGTFALLFVTALNDFVLVGFGAIELRKVAADQRVHPLTYFLLSIIPSVVGSEGLVSFLDLFVPLTGRTGEISPSDHIIATIVAALSFMSLPIMLPLAHRYGPKHITRAIAGLLIFTSIAIAVFASPSFSPWTPLTPKRIFVHQVENITDGTWSMNMGHADAAPGHWQLVDDVRTALVPEHAPAVKQVMNENNTVFDILHPVSAFLTPFKFDLPPPASGQVSPWSAPNAFTVTSRDEELDLVAGTRRVTIEVKKPGLIWSVIAFHADVLEWDLPGVSPPAGGRQRHHIKEVGRYGVESWTIRLLLRLDEDARAAAAIRGPDRAPYSASVRVDSATAAEDQVYRNPSRLWIDYSALDAEGMWPNSRHLVESRPSLKTFEKMDRYLAKSHPEVDAMLLSVVAGVAQV
ncbi:hypothetical protein IE81DRAFT_320179 [Ceraceosorus guamensis]|uniref:Peptide hydrolase n=1 Tax=Ceraceosorus guamensis TaxID=1522189 RepID=A0A316W738_9BASI|nr:hypothetical protein IE81DRAFT_320179 [Ceraceosorus guamensis]PWN45424.1 hypothetical protein IE81DRAFT_320179 [Ceraceosorus guamensis]